MKIARLVVLGIVFGGSCVAASGQTDGTDAASAQDTYKGPMGTEEHPVRVSAGAMAGLLLHKVDPEYPAERTEATGAVVMSAKVDKNWEGCRIESDFRACDISKRVD